MTTYFIDSKIGNNSNDGKSINTPFADFSRINEMTLEAGDRVLLKRDSVFCDHLVVNGCGEEFSPITVSAYGDGLKKPAILTEDGAHAAVLVKGDNVVIDGIEVSNKKGNCGISLNSTKYGANRNNAVTSCYVHDVWTENNLPARNVSAAGWQHHFGGITVETNREEPTWYENLRIENNVIENVNRTGIWLGGQWNNRFKNTLNWMVNRAPNMDDPWYPHKNVYVAYNSVDHSFGDGIVIVGVENTLIEYNRVFFANCQSRVGASNVGLWTMNCRGALVQYNEVGFTCKEYGGDGEGYDIDQCNEDNIYQFNYSHHNEGGFMLACTGCNCKDSVRDCIIRNNLSVNDGLERDIPIFTISGPMRNIKYINNTIYTENEQLFQLFRVTDYMRIGLPQDLLFANNLFVSKYTNNRNAFEMSGPITFDSNIFVNMPALPDRESVIIKDNYVGLNPALCAEFYEPGDRLDTAGFVPLWDSPLLRLGKHFPECADTDYHGLDAKNHNYIGAFYYKDANIG